MWVRMLGKLSAYLTHLSSYFAVNAISLIVCVLVSRLTMFVDHFKMALDCFSAVWFVVGNVWIFGGHSSSAEAPNLYRCH